MTSNGRKHSKPCCIKCLLLIIAKQSECMILYEVTLSIKAIVPVFQGCLMASWAIGEALAGSLFNSVLVSRKEGNRLYSYDLIRVSSPHQTIQPTTSPRPGTKAVQSFPQTCSVLEKLFTVVVTGTRCTPLKSPS